MKFENVRVYNFENALRGMRNPKESYHLIDSKYGIGPWDWAAEDASKVACLWNDNESTFDWLVKNGVIYKDSCGNYLEWAFIGPNDMRLAQTLIKAGSEHRKFMRQIFVSVDITAPLFWYKEFDTYKVGTVANSTSTMHTIHKKPIALDNFETDDYQERLALIDDIHLGVRIDNFIDDLEQLRQLYLMYHKESLRKDISEEERKEKEKIAKAYWKELIRWTPEAWLQTRTVTMSYENLLAMCSKGQRRFHKLTEWSGDGDNFVTESFIKFARTLPYAQDFIFIDELN